MVEASNGPKKDFKISPSILSLSLDEISDNIKRIENEIDFIHIDVMDGKFVLNQTDGVEMFEIAKKASKKPLDVHLMVENPAQEIKKYEGAKIITFHIEAVKNKVEALEIINTIKKMSAQVGVSIKPSTSVDILKDILEEIELVLIMSVEPGYGGQKLIPETLSKIEKLREMGFNKLIEVDGGITLENAEIVRNTGVDIIVAGTAIFSSADKIQAIQIIKGSE